MTSPRQEGHVGLPVALPALLRIDDDTYTLPAWSTRTMIATLGTVAPGCWWNLVPARLDPADRAHLVERLFDADDVLDIDELETRVTDALAHVCGMSFWAATRLAGTLLHQWFRFDGWAGKRGFAPLEQPVARVLATGYEWLASHCEKESQLAQLDNELWAPPPALLPSGRARDAAPVGWDDAREEESFMATLNQLSGLTNR